MIQVGRMSNPLLIIKEKCERVMLEEKSVRIKMPLKIEIGPVIITTLEVNTVERIIEID
jgi:hypothetical protein